MAGEEWIAIGLFALMIAAYVFLNYSKGSQVRVGSNKLMEELKTKYTNYGIKETFRFREYGKGETNYQLVGWEPCGKGIEAVFKSLTTTANIDGDVTRKITFEDKVNEPWAQNNISAFIRNESSVVYFVDYGGKKEFSHMTDAEIQKSLDQSDVIRELADRIESADATIDDKVKHRIEDIKDKEERRFMPPGVGGY